MERKRNSSRMSIKLPFFCEPLFCRAMYDTVKKDNKDYSLYVTCMSLYKVIEGRNGPLVFVVASSAHRLDEPLARCGDLDRGLAAGSHHHPRKRAP